MNMTSNTLPLAEWYKLAEKLAAPAGKMIEIGKEIESLPDNVPAELIEAFKFNMVDYLWNYDKDDRESVLHAIEDLIQAARGEE